VQNLDDGWDQAVEEAGEARARVWRLYLAASAVGFESNRLQIHQVLATKPADGRSGLPLRPDFT
jgi:cyclopropane-fatty-acyl-phospholipid synthase